MKDRILDGIMFGLVEFSDFPLRKNYQCIPNVAFHMSGKQNFGSILNTSLGI